MSRGAPTREPISMQVLRKSFIAIGFVAGLAAMVAAVAGWQLQLLAKAGDAAPRSLTVAEMAEKGTGGNIHVELTGFKFGKPIIDKNKDDAWTAVWLPLLPTADQKIPFARSVFW